MEMINCYILVLEIFICLISNKWIKTKTDLLALNINQADSKNKFAFQFEHKNKIHLISMKVITLPSQSLNTFLRISFHIFY